MKLYHRNAPLFCSVSSLPPLEDDLDDDDSATTVTVPLALESKQHQPSDASLVTLTPLSRPRRKVSFQDTAFIMTFDTKSTTATRTTTTVYTKEDCRALWYSEQDIHLFRIQHRNDIRRLHHLERWALTSSTWQPSWVTAYSHVYRICCQAKSDEEDPLQWLTDTRSTDTTTSESSLNPLTSATLTGCTLDLHTAGMERRAVPAVVADTMARRRALCRQVLHWQNAPLCRDNVELRQCVVRQRSIELSRPARLYAQHVARVSAATPW